MQSSRRGHHQGQNQVALSGRQMKLNIEVYNLQWFATEEYDVDGQFALSLKSSWTSGPVNDWYHN